MCEKELGNHRAAETQAALGLSRVPKSAELLWLGGFCAYQQGAMQRAVEWCEQAIHCGEYLHPEQDEARLRLAFRHRPADFEAPFNVLRFAYRRTGQMRKRRGQSCTIVGQKRSVSCFLDGVRVKLNSHC